MMWVLPLVGYLGVALGFGFLTLAIASGLYYLSELVEEYSVIAKRFLTRLIYCVIAIQALLYLVDGFPFKLSCLSIVSHILYLGNMRKFPIVKLSDPLFIVSCLLVLLNHYLWFSHFSAATMSASRFYYDQSRPPSFSEVASFFGLCVWLVPFALFVSLSAGDNILPTMGSEEPTARGVHSTGKRQGMIKVVVDTVRAAIVELGRLTGWWKEDRGY